LEEALEKEEDIKAPDMELEGGSKEVRKLGKEDQGGHGLKMGQGP
jgi:hypothetical protein